MGGIPSPFSTSYRKEHPGSGGAGEWRGGNGLESAFVPHKTDELLVQLVSLDHAVDCAIGLGGGLPGHPGDYRYKPAALTSAQLAAGDLPGSRVALNRFTGGLERVFAKDITLMHPGDVFVAQYCGRRVRRSARTLSTARRGRRGRDGDRQ